MRTSLDSRIAPRRGNGHDLGMRCGLVLVAVLAGCSGSLMDKDGCWTQECRDGAHSPPPNPPPTAAERAQMDREQAESSARSAQIFSAILQGLAAGASSHAPASPAPPSPPAPVYQPRSPPVYTNPDPYATIYQAPVAPVRPRPAPPAAPAESYQAPAAPARPRPAPAASAECSSDYSCPYGSRCIKPNFSTTGTCAKVVDNYGTPTYEGPRVDSVAPKTPSKSDCQFDTDCPVGFRCDFKSGACMKR